VLITLHQLNFGISQIADLTHCDPRTIHHWIDNWEEHHSLEDDQRGGRTPVTSAETDALIEPFAIETPITTPRIIRSELDIGASARTIRRRLDDVGLFGRVARMEYPFTEEHIAKRLAFAQEYGEWSKKSWDQVIFTDESYIYLGQHGQIWVQRPQDAAFVEEYMVHGQGQFAPKIGMWGCFSSRGVGPMKLFDENMDARMYTDYMARYMKPYALRTWPNKPWHFLQDNASYHGARASYQWFHNNGVSLIPLSPHSPDLNPIENLWADLKRRIEARNVSSIEELKQIASQEWSNTTSELCSRLARSMPRRCELVVEAQGFKTPY
jgi:transposase